MFSVVTTIPPTTHLTERKVVVKVSCLVQFTAAELIVKLLRSCLLTRMPLDTESCNLAYLDLLFNPHHKPKLCHSDLQIFTNFNSGRKNSLKNSSFSNLSVLSVTCIYIRVRRSFIENSPQTLLALSVLAWNTSNCYCYLLQAVINKPLVSY